MVVSREARERKTLGFLDDRDVMLGPKGLYDNLREYELMAFSQGTVRNILIDTEERGLV